MAPPASSPKALTCEHCQRQFGRVEHLKRHVATHTKETLFRCVHSNCDKEFTRQDALKRHEAVHVAAPSLQKRHARACLGCAAVKVRCSGDTVCTRCQKRGQECLYPGQAPTSIPSPRQSQTSGERDQFSQMRPPMAVNNGYGANMTADESDFWDPALLSTTNWLQDVIDHEFNMDDFHAANANFHPHENVQASLLLPTPALEENVSTGPSNGTPGTAVTFQSASTDLEAHVEPGSKYVDGEPARKAPKKRKRRRSTNATHLSVAKPTNPYTFSLRQVSTEQTGDIKISYLVYDHIQNMYNQLCLQPPFLWAPFEPYQLPSVESFGHLIKLYVENFDQILPCIHRPTFDAGVLDEYTVIAIAAIGSQYLESAESSAAFSVSMHEFSRRATIYREETNMTRDNAYWVARLLGWVGMAFCGDKSLRAIALSQRSTLADIHHALVDDHGNLRNAAMIDGGVDGGWYAWVRGEQTRRVAYAAWFVDCIIACQVRGKPSLTLAHGDTTLPCPEKWWQADGQQWSSLSNAVEIPTLNAALQQVYIEKKLWTGLGEFARVLLIYGIMQRTWDVEAYFSSPLSTWEPKARSEVSSEIIPEIPLWLPSIPAFAKWQNSACDALDVLHWQANAVIGQAAGVEHEEILHLHLARVVLLAPNAELQILALQLCQGSASLSQMRGNREAEFVQRWAIQHQYKARLAMIHAGVILWHTRRYSVDAFYEAHAVGLATLALWAWSTFAPRKNYPPPEAASSNPSSDDNADIILIDRPTDDELCQQFIRRGHTMRTHMTGVGDLYDAKAPQRILLQGIKVLDSLQCWDANAYWRPFLQELYATYQC